MQESVTTQPITSEKIPYSEAEKELLAEMTLLKPMHNTPVTQIRVGDYIRDGADQIWLQVEKIDNINGLLGFTGTVIQDTKTTIAPTNKIYMKCNSSTIIKRP